MTDSRKPRADWVLVPANDADLDAVVQQCRRLVRQRSLLAAGVAMVPVPGLDWLTDIGVLMRVLPEINAAFGLTPEQIDRLAPERRLAAFKAVSAGGGMLVGKIVTKDLVMTLLRVVGVRLTTQQAAKYVPIAGQAASAALTYSALRYVCEQHIQQCVAVARELRPSEPTEVLRAH